MLFATICLRAMSGKKNFPEEPRYVTAEVTFSKSCGININFEASPYDLPSTLLCEQLQTNYNHIEKSEYPVRSAYFLHYSLLYSGTKTNDIVELLIKQKDLSKIFQYKFKDTLKKKLIVELSLQVTVFFNPIKQKDDIFYTNGQNSYICLFNGVSGLFYWFLPSRIELDL